jgi:hypothetical protein
MMGTAFTIFLISFVAARVGQNVFFALWSDAHHTVGWLVFVGIFVGIGYTMAEGKMRGTSKVWIPRFQKIRKAVDSVSRRGGISP